MYVTVKNLIILTKYNSDHRKFFKQKICFKLTLDQNLNADKHVSMLPSPVQIEQPGMSQCYLFQRR